jgi:hypothetical protein
MEVTNKKDEQLIPKIVHIIKVEDPNKVENIHNINCDQTQKYIFISVNELNSLTVFRDLEGLENIYVCVDNSLSSTAVIFYDTIKHEQVSCLTYDKGYEVDYIPFNNKLFFRISETKEGSNETSKLLTMYPETKEYWNKENCQLVTLFKWYDKIILLYRNHNEEPKQTTDIYDDNWKLITTIKGYWVACSCRNDILVIHNFDEKCYYYDFNKKEIIDSGCFQVWKNSIAVEHDREKKCLVLKDFVPKPKEIKSVAVATILKNCKLCKRQIENDTVCEDCFIYLIKNLFGKS